MNITTYKDAIFHVKQSFLIIGLTGYTGSGCTTYRKLLEGKTFKIPKYDMKNEYDKTAESDEESSQYKSNRTQRIHEKLARTWNEVDWESFTPIEVSSVIFAFAIDRAICSNRKDDILDEIRNLIKRDEDELKTLKTLRNNEEITSQNASLIIDAYEKSAQLYNNFKKEKSRNGKLAALTTSMQNFGDEIRLYGLVSPDKKKHSAKNLFVLPEALSRLIKAYRIADKTKNKNSSHFVIDAFRNPFEIEYFRWRYSEFYLVALLRNEKERKEELGLSTEDFEKINEREKGRPDLQRDKNNIEKWITSQDIEECFLKADMFVETKKELGFQKLKRNIIKLISLVKYPGCIPPTIDERNMQIAMCARQVSGCISRRVGAIVTNKQRLIIGIGWNDPPRGQIPCSLRTGKELADGGSEDNFSDYEMEDEAFHKHIKENYNIERPFCFCEELPKVLKKKDKMREYTRSLHAEENALFQALGNSQYDLNGATLYTTSSTCTLCAKKAYQLGISRIVYIDEYSGIALM